MEEHGDSFHDPGTDKNVCLYLDRDSGTEYGAS